MRRSAHRPLETLSPTGLVADSPPKAPRRRPRSASPLRRLPDFLAKLPVETTRSSNGGEKAAASAASTTSSRRPSLGGRIVRSNSFSRLFPSKHNNNNKRKDAADNVSHWANESTSTSESTLNCSLASLEEDEWVARGFIKEVDAAIAVQKMRMADAEERVVATQELAWARYDAGNEMGAILSMRRAHESLVMVNLLQAAIPQLEEIKTAVERNIANKTVEIPELTRKRRRMVLILSKLKKAGSVAAAAKVPSDAELLEQLYEIMEVGEI